MTRIVHEFVAAIRESIDWVFAVRVCMSQSQFCFFSSVSFVNRLTIVPPCQCPLHLDNRVSDTCLLRRHLELQNGVGWELLEFLGPKEACLEFAQTRVTVPDFNGEL